MCAKLFFVVVTRTAPRDPDIYFVEGWQKKSARMCLPTIAGLCKMLLHVIRFQTAATISSTQKLGATQIHRQINVVVSLFYLFLNAILHG